MNLSTLTSAPPEVRSLGITGVVESGGGVFLPVGPAPSQPMGNPHVLFPWLRESVFTAERLRELQSKITSFSPACSDLIERLQDLIEYMTDYRPKNVKDDFDFVLYDGMPLINEHWRQWFIRVLKPCKLQVMITVEVREIAGHGFLPDWRYHVQNPHGTELQVKEITHRIRSMTAAKGTGRNHQFDVVDGILMRGMDL
jgi:hypothetical protein